MKRISILLLCLMAVTAAFAVPANPTPVKVEQADGTTITLRLVGDEFYHYTTTVDGYTVVNVDGNWEYAVLDSNKRLAPSGVIAHDAEVRKGSEKAFVEKLQKCMTDRHSVSNAQKMRAARDESSAPAKEPVIDYSKFRGLIVLINFSDVKFRMNDPNGFYDDMMNTQGYNGFYTLNTPESGFNSCTGSVRDYFFDQSMGQFDPVFDVIGPIEVPFEAKECGSGYSEVFKTALDLADEEVDFTKYDADDDGGVDMVFFLVAGYAASYSGNSRDYLWPHMSYLYGYNPDTHQWYWLEYDGMTMGRYASSTEIYGWEAYGMTGPNGIGTVCHEFGHVLGLPDLYDTDYEDHGQSNDPGDWDVMAGGSYGDYGRRPVGYSIWERTELGWAEPEILTEGFHQLESIDKSNTGFRLNTPNNYEYFLLENRQRVKWDRSLPGHGMVIARVDLSNPNAWRRNEVNINPAHNYYELVRAGGTSETTPFPGQAHVTEINSTTSPALVTWAGEPCDASISNITEASGVISFNMSPGIEVNTIVEDFETMPATDNRNEKGVEGRFSKWSFIQANVTEDPEVYYDNKGCAMAMPSAIQMDNTINADIIRLSMDATNTSTQDSKLQLYYSTDNGANWITIGNSVTIAAGASKEPLIWKFNYNEPVSFRIVRTAGNKNYDLYIDNFTVHYTGEIRDNYLLGDIDNNGIVDVEDVNAAINIILKIKTVADYPGNGDMDGNGIIDVEDVNAIINIILKIN